MDIEEKVANLRNKLTPLYNLAAIMNQYSNNSDDNWIKTNKVFRECIVESNKSLPIIRDILDSMLIDDINNTDNGFITPCYMTIKDSSHYSHIMKELKFIGDRTTIKMQNNVPFPCICAVSKKTISICQIEELALDGHINCEDNETLFLALAALRPDSDIFQWLTDGNKWVISDVHTLLKLKEYFETIGFDYSKTHKASVEELIKHFKL